VRYGAVERKRLERLCRYITRPAIANERPQCNRSGPVALRLKRPHRDGTTPIAMLPPEFMQRLAAWYLRAALAGPYELGAAAQARLRDRSGPLPELGTRLNAVAALPHLTKVTGRSVRWTTFVAIDPMTRLPIRVMPRVPITMESHPSRFACCVMVGAISPMRTSVV
jgi:hypothetical protein